MKKSKIVIYTECAIMVALATVLSMLPLVKMPDGGSITVASALPILVLSYRRGVRYGVLSGFLYSSLQLLLGLKNLSYFTTWYSVLAVILLDYLVAFTVVGLGGAFRKYFTSQANALAVGALTVSMARYILHTIAGATVWAGISIPTGATLVYSISYNATYMLPETIVLALAAFYIGGVLNFSAPRLSPIKKDEGHKIGWLSYVGGAALLAALVYDVVAVFSCLQNADTGEFDITGIADVSWIPVIIVSIAGVLIAAILALISNKAAKKS
jgi:thiamine transporter